MFINICVWICNRYGDWFIFWIPVKCGCKCTVKRVKCTLWCWNSTSPRVYFSLILSSDIFPVTLMLCMFHTALPSPSIRHSSSKPAHRLGCREMLKMKSLGCSLLWYCKLLLPSHFHTPFYLYNIYSIHTHSRQVCVDGCVCDWGPFPLPQRVSVIGRATLAQLHF